MTGLLVLVVGKCHLCVIELALRTGNFALIASDFSVFIICGRKNIYPNRARMKNRTDLNLDEVVYISIIYHIPDS